MLFLPVTIKGQQWSNTRTGSRSTRSKEIFLATPPRAVVEQRREDERNCTTSVACGKALAL